MDPKNAPQIDPSTEIPNPGEGSGRRVSSRRNSGGGVLAVLGLIVPVVLGGVTVFGVYFLFLEDLLKPAKPSKPKAKSSLSTPETSKSEGVSNSPPQPTFAPPTPLPDPVPVPENKPVKTKLQNPVDTLAKREEDAANALRLAEKMWKIKPGAAEPWYRKVVEKYPNTKAGQKANDWLKQQNAEP